MLHPLISCRVLWDGRSMKKVHQPGPRHYLNVFHDFTQYYLIIRISQLRPSTTDLYVFDFYIGWIGYFFFKIYSIGFWKFTMNGNRAAEIYWILEIYFLTSSSKWNQANQCSPTLVDHPKKEYETKTWIIYRSTEANNRPLLILEYLPRNVFTPNYSTFN